MLDSISPHNQHFTVAEKHGHSPIDQITPQLLLPPMNTNITTTMLTQYEIGTPSKISVMDSQPPVPLKWDWRHEYPEDKNYTNMSTKKKFIEKPRNQYLCGSCWAISTASIVSDMFVAAGITNYPPKLSQTYLLSETGTNKSNVNPCKSNKCGGGSNSLAFKCIEENGIASEFCVNNSWCTNDNICTNPLGYVKDVSDFKAENKTTYLNSKIPPAGCFYPNNKLLYFIKDVRVSPQLDKYNVDAFRLETKHNLIQHGPVSAGFIVYNNFVNGDYSITNGIYLEGIDYENSSHDKIIAFDTNNSKPIGGHAITVIGWGIEDNVEYSPGKKENIHYWYCRNSWGEKWGKDKGYFKFAMWPYNNKCGFDNPVRGLGGFVSATVADIKPHKIDKQIPEYYMKGIDKDFYKNENKPEEHHYLNKADYQSHKNMIWTIIGSVIGGLIVLGLIIWLFVYMRWISKYQKFKLL